MSPRQTIAHYRILSKLGEGGMGAVYRATDTKLNRDVALKVLPPAVAEDSARMARFEREAQVLASLNHPNIAAIYGIEAGALVMELVEGPDLAGPVSIDTAIAYARQIAAGLEAAHEKGIVHRDLKPANIKVTSDGTVKLLDFGLAKAAESGSAPSGIAQSISPTLSLAMTQAGMILGTAAYMAPEQARGKAVDKRADIWAFGVVLFELLTGKQLFAGGDTITDIIAAVVTREPDWKLLPAETPPRVRRLLELCLRKDPKLRLRDIGDARLVLDEPEPVATATTSTVRNPRWWIGAFTLLALALAGLAAVHFRETAPIPEVIRFQVPPPEGGNFSQMTLALSPDGRKLAFMAAAKASNPAILWIRSLDSLELTSLPGTEFAYFPFWSADGRSIGFWSQGKLKRIAISGGPPQELCDTAKLTSGGQASGTWGSDGTILFSAGGSGIYRVPEAGGEPVRISEPNLAAGETSRFYPRILPDGTHFLYHSFFTKREQNAAYLASMDGKVNKRILVTPQATAFAPPQSKGLPAHLVFLRQETLMAQPLDGQSYERVGEAFQVAKGVGGSLNYGLFTVSPNGTLAYRGGGIPTRQPNWYDRTGKLLSTLGEPGLYNHVALSRDGTHAAVALQDPLSANRDLWIIDVARNVPTRFTFDGLATDAVWSPDDARLAMSSRHTGGYALYVKDTRGADAEVKLQDPVGGERPTDWSDDNRFLLYTRIVGGINTIWTISDPAGDASSRKSAAYLETPYNTSQAQFAPGPGAPHWIAYTSDESRQSNEVYVQSFPLGAGKLQISRGGGTQPRWRRDGKELFYLAPDGKLMAVDVKPGSRFEAGIPRVLFETRYPDFSLNNYRYDVSADGQRFLILTAPQNESGGADYITVVTNWLAGVKR